MNHLVSNVSPFSTFSSFYILPHVLLPPHSLLKQTQRQNETFWKWPSFATPPTLTLPTTWSSHPPRWWLPQMRTYSTSSGDFETANYKLMISRLTFLDHFLCFTWITLTTKSAGEAHSTCSLSEQHSQCLLLLNQLLHWQFFYSLLCW